MRFSQRIGKTTVRTALQVESVDVDLKNRLWNTILEDFFQTFHANGWDSPRALVCNRVWKDFFKKPIDKIPTYINSSQTSTEGFIVFLREWYFKGQWYELFDFIEFLSTMDQIHKGTSFTQKCNEALQGELSAYRIIDQKVIQITSENEILEIENAIDSTSKWKSVNEHLKRSIEKISDRKNPDYRNSIKEAISSVEAFCRIITGDSTATLGRALSEIEKKHQIHSGLKSAFSSIYGYTSDSSGIRHSLLEEDFQVNFEDAKFMLIACSAFINYLRAKTTI